MLAPYSDEEVPQKIIFYFINQFFTVGRKSCLINDGKFSRLCIMIKINPLIKRFKICYKNFYIISRPDLAYLFAVFYNLVNRWSEKIFSLFKTRAVALDKFILFTVVMINFQSQIMTPFGDAVQRKLISKIFSLQTSKFFRDIRAVLAKRFKVVLRLSVNNNLHRC